MIWIALAAAVIAIGGAWFVAKSWATRGIVLGAAIAAIAAYAFIGRPGMGDQPLSARLDELEVEARDHADEMRPDQLMALLQKRALDDPEDPTPHKFMGDLLEATGRPSEAMMSYQAALRRDPAFQPALKSLADLLFKQSGTVGQDTMELYRRAYQLDPSDARIGFMAALGDWLAGRKAEAEVEWARIEEPLAPDDPRRQMFQAFRQAYGVDEASEEMRQPATPEP